MGYFSELLDDGLSADDLVVQQHLELLLGLLHQEEADRLRDTIIQSPHDDSEVSVQPVSDLLDKQLVWI